MKYLVFFLTGCLLMAGCRNRRDLSVTEKEEIIAELQEIKRVDQQFAGIPPEELREAYGNQKAWEIYKRQRDSVGRLNQDRIKAMYREYGYLGEKKVGKEAAVDFWLPIQHADNDVAFQQEMLDAMAEEIENGSDDRYHFAMLEDRIRVNREQPQRFGSQVDYNEFGQAIPSYGLVDSLKVDSLRAAYNLPPLKEYYNQMTRMNFEMNKQLFLDKGIAEPMLYE